MYELPKEFLKLDFHFLPRYHGTNLSSNYGLIVFMFKDVTTDFVWKQEDPNTIVSTSKVSEKNITHFLVL